MALAVSKYTNDLLLMDATTLAENEVIAAALKQQDEDVTNLTTKKAKKKQSNRVMTSQAPILSGAKAPKSNASKPVSPITPPPVTIPNFSIVDKPNDDEPEKRLEQMQQFYNHLESIIEDRKVSGMTNTTPIAAPRKLEDLPEPTPAQQKEIFNMVAYMVALLTASIELASDQSKVSGDNTNMSNDMLKLNESQTQKAIDSLNKLLKEEYDASHMSFWQKLGHAFEALGDLIKLACEAISGPMQLLMGVSPKDLKQELKDTGNDFLSQMGQSGGFFQELVAVLMVVAGALTGNPVLAAMGVLMFAMNLPAGSNGSSLQSDLDSAINSATHGNTGLNILIEVSIAIGEAVALGGVSGLCSALTDATESTAASAAGDASASGSESATGDAAGDAAGTAAGDSGTATAELSAETTQQSTQTMGQSLAKKILEKGFGQGLSKILSNMLAKTLMTAGTTGLYSDIVKGAILLGEEMHMCNHNLSQSDLDEASTIGGAVLGIGATLGTMGLEQVENKMGGLAAKIEAKLSKAAFDDLKTLAKTFTSLVNMLAATANISQGLNMMKQADTMKDMADAQSLQSFYGDLMSILNSITSSDTASSNALFSDNAEVNSRWDAIFVTPWNQA